MNLPHDLREVVTAGIATLRATGMEVRSVATKRPDAPQLWLVVRDLEGLADRLAIVDEWQWQDGFLDLLVTGQDLGVLDELLTVGVPLNDTALVSLTPGQANCLTRLRDLLRRRAGRISNSDEPAA